MIKCLNPPCNSSLATSCAKSVMASSSGEGKLATLFNEVVSSSAVEELAIDETASTVSLAPNVCVVPGVSVDARKSKECVDEFVDHLSVEESAACHFVLEGEADDNDTFVDVMSGFIGVGDAESEGSTFADALGRANLSVETLAEGVVDTSHMLICESSFFITYYFLVCRSNMVATHIFHKLVISARLFM